MRYIAIIALLFASPAFAQQPLQPASPNETALFSKLSEEITENVHIRAALIQARARVKELEDKYEPNKPGPTKP
jgi:hypothetical protein